MAGKLCQFRYAQSSTHPEPRSQGTLVCADHRSEPGQELADNRKVITWLPQHEVNIWEVPSF